ncbi:acyl-CoA dehydrogenase family protein [Nocardia sp. NBC_01388]|uniref:acyl-CoA dehydrogenase family protein n=1 Tax=Nocardia sp. NBC_01388 TaxID=2903596 RepID=UPI00324F6DEF
MSIEVGEHNLDLAEYRQGLRRMLADRNDTLDRWRRHYATVEETVAEHAQLVRLLHDSGWSRYGWPESVGGVGGDERHRAMLYDELAAAGLPIPEQYLPLETLGPAMLHFAPEAAAELLPAYLRGDEWWGQGFSEPEAGSDLASLRCRAVREGDEYVVTGQKIWTSHGATARRLMCLVRTGTPDSRHRGLSMLLIDTDTPGVLVRPLALASGRNELAEVFFDGVKVPAGRLIGGEGQGWAVAMYLLQWERSMFAWQCSATILRVLRTLRDDLAGSSAMPADAAARLARSYIDVVKLRARTVQTITRLAAGEAVGPEVSVDKILLAGADQGAFDTVRDLSESYFTLGQGMGSQRSDWWYSRSATILGGSAEVQRGILADRVLNLPKD